MNTFSTAVHAAAQRVGRRERDGGRADVHADHVREAAHAPARRARARTSARARRRPCSPRTGRPTKSSVRPALRAERPPGEHHARDQRADGRRAAQDAEPLRAGVQDRAREDRQQRDRAAEEHGEEIERDRAEQHRRPPDEADPGHQALEPGASVADGRRRREASGPEQRGCTRARTRGARSRARRRAPGRRRRARRRSQGRRSPPPGPRSTGAPSRSGAAPWKRPRAGSTRPAGAPSAPATPVAAASARNGQSWFAPADGDDEQQAGDGDLDDERDGEHDRRREKRSAIWPGGQSEQRQRQELGEADQPRGRTGSRGSRRPASRRRPPSSGSRSP